jgi:uncharacterized membrane protein (DUF485 family)
MPLLDKKIEDINPVIQTAQKILSYEQIQSYCNFTMITAFTKTLMNTKVVDNFSSFLESRT